MTHGGTRPINRFFADFPESTREYMEGFRTRFGADDVSELLDRMRDLSVLVVGDTILDDYHFCRTLGTSSKDAALAVQHESSEMFAGGVLAVANHVANFARSTRVVTVLGGSDDHRAFIDSKLNGRIETCVVTKPGAPTTLKRRFIDGYFVTKLFEKQGLRIHRK